ncbi:YkgJ family cysteine cluster protein [Novosphingobium hassiacum]|uniref:YkgJ family cysteine cluster protein n=1 Tax=Novosphingobium hassiacum TaxID=173676 RepID=UPI001622AE27|nr:YkgJ family cysteine cluster protein [Novosphingobium hassiacum]
MQTTPSPSLASRLCLACAMCCDGTIYDVAVVREGEAERAASIGFTLTTGEDGRAAFKLPCHHLEGTACQRYQDWRPSTCGKFRCATQVQALMATSQKATRSNGSQMR